MSPISRHGFLSNQQNKRGGGKTRDGGHYARAAFQSWSPIIDDKHQIQRHKRADEEAVADNPKEKGTTAFRR